MSRPARTKSTWLCPVWAWLLFGAARAFALGEDEFLPPEQAFEYTATADESAVTVEWRAVPGYYLYKKRMGLGSATAGISVGEPRYPKGEIHKDEYFGEQEVFRGTFKVTAPLTGAKAGDAVALELKWQGCADAGLCYPPSVWKTTVKVAAAAEAGGKTADSLFEQVQPWTGAASEDEFLDPDVAFVLTGSANTPNNVTINWRIADGYYLYKERMKVEPAGAAGTVAALVLPKGEMHHDEYFGEQEIFRGSLDASFAVPPSEAKSIDVNVTYQGCADSGLCYTPITKTSSIPLDGAAAAVSVATPAGGEFISEQD